MTDIYCIKTLKSNGNLFISPRPRGNDWLEDEIQHFKKNKITILINALTFSEIYELELEKEEQYCKKYHINYLSYPIDDRSVPLSKKEFLKFTLDLSEKLFKGENILIHCRQGIGRSSLLVVGILMHITNFSVNELFTQVSISRGEIVPDTLEQKNWLRK